MSEFESRIGCLNCSFGALAGPNGATWDSPGCNPGFRSGINPSALKGPDRDAPGFRRIRYGSPARQALKALRNRHYALSGLGIWLDSQGVALGYPISPLRGNRMARRMSEFALRIDCPIIPFRALAGPNGAAWDSPGCNPGSRSGFKPSALKGPDRDAPRFRRIEAVKGSLRASVMAGEWKNAIPLGRFGPSAGPNGATWDSPGCNPGFRSGINPSALKGPDRDAPGFRRIEAIKANLRGLAYGG